MCFQKNSHQSGSKEMLFQKDAFRHQSGSKEMLLQKDSHQSVSKEMLTIVSEIKKKSWKNFSENLLKLNLEELKSVDTVVAITAMGLSSVELKKHLFEFLVTKSVQELKKIVSKCKSQDCLLIIKSAGGNISTYSG